MGSNIFRENLRYISTLGRYNTERRPVIRKYFASRISDSEFTDEKLDVAEIREFASQKQSRTEGVSPDFEEMFEESLLTLPEDINPQDFQGYLLFRYSHREEQAEDYGHEIKDSTDPYFSRETGDGTRYDLLYTKKDEGVKAVAEYDEAAGEMQGF